MSGTARFGVAAALATLVLQIAYGVVLVGGLMALSSPDQPIPDPYFTAMEGLILLIAPAMLALMVAIHAAAPAGRRPYALLAVACTTVMATLTAAVHFSVLTLARHPAFAGHDDLLAFRWPSVVYAIDILAWDVFFALAALAAAAAFPGPGLAAAIRALLVASGLVAFAGLAGVAAGDMAIRNIGIVGYGLLFPVASGLIALHFRRLRA